ncbi:MAG: tail fiber domain-containing protein [Saprospiraceae bacterium]|nr:tail fiber domain-containing protein [Saprospiraceae bacterium]
MKNTLSFLISLIFSATVFAQTVPQGINYQAVARDTTGNELSNQSLSVQFSILSGSATGTITWQETHAVTTNDYGLFTAIIGQGTSTGSGSSATFDAVDWGAAAHYLKVELDDGGGTYMDMGTTTFMSVPYALQSGNTVFQFNNNGTGIQAPTNTASGDYSTAMGYLTESSGNYSTAMGRQTEALGNYSTAMGSWAVALGDYSTAMGYLTESSGNYSTAMGLFTKASQEGSTAMGWNSIASGWISTSMGYNTYASGYNSTSLGRNTIASAYVSTAMGLNTTASAYVSTVMGRFNVGGGDPNNWITTDPIFEIGNGVDSANRNNALTVLKNGSVGIGTSSPIAKLQLNNGRILFSLDDPSYNSFINLNNTNHNLRFQTSGSAFASFNGNRNVGLGLQSSDKVGIGTNAPNEKLHIYGGSIKIDDGTNPYTLPSGDGTFNQVLKTDGAGVITWEDQIIDDLIDAKTQASNGTALQYSLWLANGINAGAAAQTGTLSDARANLAIGPNSQKLITSGDYNISLGYQTLDALTTGSSNVVMGYNAGSTISTTSGNVLIGYNAGYATSGSHQVAIGNGALGASGGEGNVAIGRYALLNATHRMNIAIGRLAGAGITSGQGNLAMGYNTMYGSSNYTGSFNIALGYNTTLSGYGASRELSIGYGPNEILMRGIYPSAGQCKLLINAQGSDTPSATLHIQGQGQTNATQSLLIESTNKTLMRIYDSGDAIQIGANAGYVSGSATNISIGASSCFYPSGANNISIGNNALTGTSTGNSNNNIAIGGTSLHDVIDARRNVAIGYGAGNAVTGGDDNIFLGTYTGDNITTGSTNIIIGNNLDASSATVQKEFNLGHSGAYLMRGTYEFPGQAKLLINEQGSGTPLATLHVKGQGTTNSSTSFLVEDSGGNALLTVKDDGLLTINNTYTMPNADGTSNQVLTTDGSGILSWMTPTVNTVFQFYSNGTGIQAPSNTASGYRSTAMGGSTTASGHYSTAMGSNTVASGYYSTAMGNGVTAIGNGELYNSGNIKGATFISTSDRRVKQNIAPFSGAISKVMLMSPKTYYYNTEEFPRFEAEKDKPQIGFIAQEVEAIFPEMVTTDGDEVGLKGVRYGQLTSVLVQAIKEQQEMIISLQKENEDFKNRIIALENK